MDYESLIGLENIDGNKRYTLYNLGKDKNSREFAAQLLVEEKVTAKKMLGLIPTQWRWKDVETMTLIWIYGDSCWSSVDTGERIYLHWLSTAIRRFENKCRAKQRLDSILSIE